MIQLRVIQHLQNGMNRARSGIVRTVYQTTDAGMNQGTRTHGAWFNCSKQFTVSQTMISDPCASLPERDNFSVGSGIVVAEILIPTSADHLASANDYRSHGHLPHFQSSLRAPQRFLHEDFVGGDRAGCLVNSRSWTIGVRHCKHFTASTAFIDCFGRDISDFWAV